MASPQNLEESGRLSSENELNGSMKKIFISHAASDKALVDGFVDLLDTGTALNQTDMFCSSVNGLGLPNYSDFVENIKKHLEEAQLVILVLSPAFLKSSFCNCELGASWFANKECFILLAPPLKFEDAKGILTGRHVGTITDSAVLDELKDYLHSALSIDAATARWNEKKAQFLSSVPRLVKAQQEPTEAAGTCSGESSNVAEDIQKPARRDGPIDFAELADSFLELFPILYWLDLIVPAKYAGTYFDRMQRVFHGSNGVFDGTNENLLFATDNILRCLSQIQISEGYCYGKMRAAYNYLGRYLTAHGESVPDFLDGNIRDIVRETQGGISIYLNNKKIADKMDVLLMRLMIALLSYYDNIAQDTLYKDIERDVQHSLRLYLETGLLANHKISLPEIPQIDEADRLKALCEFKWVSSVENRIKEGYKDKCIKIRG